jgi:predicted nucleic acid-binding protein
MIFGDSSYFIATIRKKDRWHNDALNLKIKEQFLISELIISESITLVGSFEGGKVGKILYNYFLDNCRIEYLDEEMMEKSMDTFLKYDGTLSLTDSSSIEIMKKHDVKKIISFDSDFDKVQEIIRIH